MIRTPDLKERFLALYNSIDREGAGDLLAWLESSDFFTAPASTRFHGAHASGLLEHSLNVCDCLLKQLETCGISGNYEPDTIAVVALLHDLCKVNFCRKGFRNVKDELGQWQRKEVFEVDEKFPCGDHADKSIILIQQFMKLKPEEILAIRAHMGGFDNAVRGGAPFADAIFTRSKLALCLHMADTMLSVLCQLLPPEFARSAHPFSSLCTTSTPAV